MQRHAPAGLLPEQDSVHILAGITAAVVAALPKATYAGLARTRERGHVAAQAPTHQLVRVLDDLQTALRQGPCVTAVREQRIVHITNMNTDMRWPDFAACAAQLGVGSMLSLQLVVDNDVVGTLNLYSPDPDAFTGDDETLAGVFANQAAITLHGVAAHETLAHRATGHDLLQQIQELARLSHDAIAARTTRWSARASRHAPDTPVSVAEAVNLRTREPVVQRSLPALHPDQIRSDEPGGADPARLPVVHQPRWQQLMSHRQRGHGAHRLKP